MIVLQRGENTLALLPETGGSVAWWRFAGRDLLSPVVDENLRAQRGEAIAAYPLVPYSNRIGNASFSFEGETFTLAKNFGGEENSIHGNGWERAWEPVQVDEDRAILVLDHDPSDAERAAEWPFAYRCVQSFVLTDRGFDLEMLVVNRDSRPQPIGFGFHPYVARSPGATLRFSAASVWESGPDNLPRAIHRAEGDWSFADPRPMASVTIDNCFAGWDGSAELEEPEEGRAITISADPVFQHLVVFSAPGKPFVAVEPVTNMSDAIHHPESVERGLHVLAPGARLSGVVRVRLVDKRG